MSHFLVGDSHDCRGCGVELGEGSRVRDNVILGIIKDYITGPELLSVLLFALPMARLLPHTEEEIKGDC